VKTAKLIITDGDRTQRFDLEVTEAVIIHPLKPDPTKPSSIEVHGLIWKDRRMKFFRPGQVQRVVNISYRQLQYWDMSGLVCPIKKIRERFRVYDFEDLVMLDLLIFLRTMGFSIQNLRQISEDCLRPALRDVNGRPLDEMKILVDSDGETILITDNFEIAERKSHTYHIYDCSLLRKRIDARWPVE